MLKIITNHQVFNIINIYMHTLSSILNNNVHLFIQVIQILFNFTENNTSCMI